MRKKLLRSRSGFEKPESREEAIMQNILGASNVLDPAESNIEEILQAILYNTPYTKEAEFEIEKILLAIKNNGTYDGEGESRDMKILIAILNGLDYTEGTESRIEELFVEWLHQRSNVNVLEGVPPLTFVAKGNPLINYEISGNTVQSGTPTSDNPIMPQGTGERTGNLWNEEGFSAKAITSTHEHTDTNTYGTTLSTTIGKEAIITQSEYPTGTVGYQNGFFFIDVDFSKYEIGDKITLSFDYICNEVHAIESQISTTLYAGKNSNIIPVVLSSGKWSVSGRLTTVITVIADMNPYVEVRLCGNSITVKNIMLNTGGTAKTYEPYGYKIPISSASITKPVYLGEVETTRKVKKLVLDGTESWTYESQYSRFALIRTDAYYSGAVRTTPCNCSHYQPIYDGRTIDNVPNESIYITSSSGRTAFNIKSTDFTSVTDFKAYLAAQYANGTPVTIWYALAAEETDIVNEPLMRIGDYADTLSMEQAGVQIPTANGSNTLDVDTTLKPSNVYIEYK